MGPIELTILAVVLVALFHRRLIDVGRALGETTGVLQSSARRQLEQDDHTE